MKSGNHEVFLCCILFISLLLFTNKATGNDSIALKNKHIQLQFTKMGDAFTLSQISRTDGTDKIAFNSVEFEILLLNDERLTINDYELRKINKYTENGIRILKLDHTLVTDSEAPEELYIVYELGEGSFFRKQIILESDSPGFTDRLQVHRFTTDQPAEGGGHGQPVYINKWFFGMDYPGFYSRHSNNFIVPQFNMRVPYTIDLDGREQEFAEEKGLVSFYHFPGHMQEIPGKKYQIKSKKAVIGIAPDKSFNAELALLSYIEGTRLQPRSFLHFNNWYSIDAKKITRENFVNKTYLPIKKQFDKYDVKLDAMVPDAGWQDTNIDHPPYRIYKPKLDENHEDLVDISNALQKYGTNLGLWFNFDGRKQNIENGEKNAGYQSAFNEEFDREKYKWTSKDFFDILNPKYQEDLKESLRYLIQDAEVNYFKHDFNHLFTSNYISERHAREKCLDVALELLEYERDLNPEIFINYTNGSWFSPFWFQHVHTLWMMSGDSGGNGDYPQLSLREGATTYRDKYFYDNFRMERTDRPVIPIANFMTHGILFSKRKPFTDFNDIIDDWSNYVVMYYARGTTVKELYITHDLLSDKEWEVLGKASKWAVKNQQQLLNTIYIGGDPSKGEAYGYISWREKKAILTVRNPQRIAQRISVPFNEKVYYTGEDGLKFKAKCVYPFIGNMGWQLISGEDFTVDVPGDCVMVFEIEKGLAVAEKAATPLPIPEAEVVSNGNEFSISFSIPDRDYRRFDLIIEIRPALNSVISINNLKAEASRENRGKKWSLSSWDLKGYRGEEVSIKGNIQYQEQTDLPDNMFFKVYLLADQKVDEAEVDNIEDLPLNIMQGYRRSSKLILDLETNKDLQ